MGMCFAIVLSFCSLTIQILRFLAKYKNVTKIRAMGRAGDLTLASMHGKTTDADRTDGELAKRMQAKGRQYQSEELSKANDEFKKRMEAKREEEERRFRQLDVDGCVHS